MKNLKLTLGILSLAAFVMSCEDSKQKEADQLVDNYTTYVDSVKGLDNEASLQNWDAIAAEEQNRKMKAEGAVSSTKDQAASQENVNEASMKFEQYKKDLQESQAKMQKTNLRAALFTTHEVGDDMAFAWVNKDNILSVYENFVNTVEANKDNYSREDWDEIKLLYEALDTRKNTVEKEGLSGEDNREIAALKVKFAPMYTVNRIGAKTEENSEAKE